MQACDLYSFLYRITLRYVLMIYKEIVVVNLTVSFCRFLNEIFYCLSLVSTPLLESSSLHLLTKVSVVLFGIFITYFIRIAISYLDVNARVCILPNSAGLKKIRKGM